jgi:hypothetical protein
MKDIIVYTAITHGYDALMPPPDRWRDEADFVAFLDEPKSDSGWQSRPIYRKFNDPCRNAKIHKILPHKYFPQTKYSLWIDGNINITSTLSLHEWIKEFLGKHDLAVFKHPRRSCIYQEASWCILHELDNYKVIDAQMREYHKRGYPANNGLAECRVLFRRHTAAMERFDEAWYEEIRTHSRRDQLSFNYVARKRRFKFTFLPGAFIESPHFSIAPHHIKRSIQKLNGGDRIDPVQMQQERNYDKLSMAGENPPLDRGDNGQRQDSQIAFDKPDVVILSHPRSGTHFLEASLNSHPRIHKRGQCVLRYNLRHADQRSVELQQKAKIFSNEPGRVNIAIVMYSEVEDFERLCGPLARCKVIHLLRNSKDVARSVAQWQADKAVYGTNSRAHYKLGEKPLPKAPLQHDGLADIEAEVKKWQRNFTKQLQKHPAVMVVRYEEITHNRQVNRLSYEFGKKILNFLGLGPYPLHNELRKTGEM